MNKNSKRSFEPGSMAISPLICLIFFTLFSISSAVSPSSQILNAVETLSDSGFTSMALTLQLTFQTLIPESSSAYTIFAPSDDAFINSGQPSLILLQYHFSPLKFKPEDLKSLPFGTKIPTLFRNHSLIVTNSVSDGKISLNNIQINESVIYDDGSLIIYAIDRFFDPSFQIASLSPSSESEPCMPPILYDREESGGDSFYKASDLLSSRGYSAMASFLNMQLIEVQDQTKLTVFAPMDDVLLSELGNITEFSSVLGRHVLPCRFTWSDLIVLEDGTEVQTFLKGFKIKITRSGDILLLNGTPIIFPDMYYRESLVIHGLRQVIGSQVHPDQAVDSFPEFQGNEMNTIPDGSALKG